MLFGGGVALLVRSDPAASVQAASPKAVKRDGIAVFFNESSFIRSLYIRPNYVMPFCCLPSRKSPYCWKAPARPRFFGIWETFITDGVVLPSFFFKIVAKNA